jgi:hypothetical protein
MHETRISMVENNKEKKFKFGAHLSFSPCLSPMYCFSLFFIEISNKIG